MGTGDTTYKVLPTYTGINNITQISLGGTHTLALDTEGHVWSWGYNGYGELGNGTTTSSTEKVQVPNLTDVIQISAGSNTMHVLKKDGTVWSWGRNDCGEYGDGTTVSKKPNISN